MTLSREIAHNNLMCATMPTEAGSCHRTRSLPSIREGCLESEAHLVMLVPHYTAPSFGDTAAVREVQRHLLFLMLLVLVLASLTSTCPGEHATRLHRPRTRNWLQIVSLGSTALPRTASHWTCERSNITQQLAWWLILSGILKVPESCSRIL